MHAGCVEGGSFRRDCRLTPTQYRQAENTDALLLSLSTALKDIIERLNRMTSGGGKEAKGEGSVEQMVEVANAHLTALQFINARSEEIKGKLDAVSEEVRKAEVAGRR